MSKLKKIVNQYPYEITKEIENKIQTFRPV